MKSLSKKELREYRDPLLDQAEDANQDIASLCRFADVYGVEYERICQSGSGSDHAICAVTYRAKTSTSKGELKLSWGFVFEYKKHGISLGSSLLLERHRDMVALMHDLENNKWRLRASVTESGKLIKLLETHGIEGGEGSVLLKKDRYILVKRDLIEYFHKRQERHTED